MKKITLLGLCLVGLLSVQAQTPKKVATKATPAKKVSQSNTVKQTPATTVSLTSGRVYTAKADSAYTGSQFDISDPILLKLSTGDYSGRDARASSSGIYGMPKGSYGFSNGKITFNTTGATSTGGITGVGSVGTGSTMGNIGSNGLRGTNGKNPYAGSAMWGNTRGLRYAKDSTTKGIGF